MWWFTVEIFVFRGLKVSAEARFLLQAMVCREADFPSLSFTVKKASKQLGLSERLVRSGAQELLESGLLTSEKPITRIGRPLQEYTSSQLLRKLMGEVDRSQVNHSELINKLFGEPEIYALGPGVSGTEEVRESNKKSARKLTRGDGRPAAPGAKGRLAAPARMLLAALLSFADDCGVATGVGEAKLREMTGLNAPALKHQLRRLASFGFIRTHVPGVSNSIFIGSKVPAIYYLNLSHPQLCEKQVNHGLVIYVARGPQKFSRLALGVPSNKALRALGPNALEMLHHKLAGHTSRLLTAVWGESDEVARDLKVNVASEVVKDLGRLWIGDPSKTKGSYWPDTQENFYSAACQWAELLHRRLSRWGVWKGYRPQQVRIISVMDVDDGVTFTSLIVYPMPQADSKCLAIWDHHNGHVDEYGCEASLGLAARYDIGLLRKV